MLDLTKPSRLRSARTVALSARTIALIALVVSIFAVLK